MSLTPVNYHKPKNQRGNLADTARNQLKGKKDPKIFKLKSKQPKKKKSQNSQQSEIPFISQPLIQTLLFLDPNAQKR